MDVVELALVPLPELHHLDTHKCEEGFSTVHVLQVDSYLLYFRFCSLLLLLLLINIHFIVAAFLAHLHVGLPYFVLVFLFEGVGLRFTCVGTLLLHLIIWHMVAIDHVAGLQDLVDQLTLWHLYLLQYVIVLPCVLALLLVLRQIMLCLQVLSFFHYLAVVFDLIVLLFVWPGLI